MENLVVEKPYVLTKGKDHEEVVLQNYTISMSLTCNHLYYPMLYSTLYPSLGKDVGFFAIFFFIPIDCSHS